jgi:hypothetical protein
VTPASRLAKVAAMEVSVIEGLGDRNGVADEADLGLGLDDPHALEDRSRIGQLPVREGAP